MATYERTHKITEGIAGEYFDIVDTTSDSVYIDLGITDRTAVNDIQITIYSYEDDTTRTYSAYSDNFDVDSFFADGVTLYYNSCEDADDDTLPFEDGKYEIKSLVFYNDPITTVIDAGGDEVFSSITEANSLKYIFSSNWKETYRDINNYVNNSIKIKNWLTSLRLANEAKLTLVAERILKALKKAIS